MKKYYNFETLFKSLKDEFRQFLKENNIYYELSEIGNFCGWHFEILCTPEDVNRCNNWLNAHTITEVN